MAMDIGRQLAPTPERLEKVLQTVDWLTETVNEVAQTRQKRSRSGKTMKVVLLAAAGLAAATGASAGISSLRHRQEAGDGS